MHLVQPDT